ncbi:MAG: ImmA/IrrE family metallo-endopeptidase [Pirellulales bacterium]
MVSDLIDRRTAEYEAEQVLKVHLFPSLPICPFRIAAEKDIIVQAKDSKDPGISGFLMRVGSVFGIQYAQHIANDGFIRFTVAHELGHYFLPEHPKQLFGDGDGIHQSRSGFVSNDRYERQADYFASALLMPESRFRNEINTAGQGFAAIEELSRRFVTSLTATAIRFAQFTDDTVAVVMSTGQSIDYCFMSDRLRDLSGITWIKKGDLLPPAVATARFNRNQTNIEQGATNESTCQLDDWFDGAPAVEVNEDVVGLGSYGKTLTVLFTDEDIEDDSSDDYEDD